MTFDPNLTQRIVARAKRRVVRDWRARMRDYSTTSLAVGAASVAVWTTLPADLKEHLPAEAVAWLIGALNACGLVGKFIVQDPPREEGK